MPSSDSPRPTPIARRARAASASGRAPARARRWPCRSQPQLLEPARHPDRPALVAEVALDLADDRRRGVRRELHAALGVEPVDRLDQADGGDLDEVVERLAAVAEPAGAVLHQGQVQVRPVPRGMRCRSRSRRSASASTRTARARAGPGRARRPVGPRVLRSEPCRTGRPGSAPRTRHRSRVKVSRRSSWPRTSLVEAVSTCQAKLS